MGVYRPLGRHRGSVGFSRESHALMVFANAEGTSSIGGGGGVGVGMGTGMGMGVVSSSSRRRSSSRDHENDG